MKYFAYYISNFSATENCMLHNLRSLKERFYQTVLVIIMPESISYRKASAVITTPLLILTKREILMNDIKIMYSILIKMRSTISLHFKLTKRDNAQ